MNDFSAQLQLFLSPSPAEACAVCNQISQPFGLALSEGAAQRLAVRRADALRETGRVEVGQGVLPKLVKAFCDSPYLDPHRYEETLGVLQALFYSFKGACHERLSDDELIGAMCLVYNEAAQGSLVFLADVSGTTLCQIAQNGSFAGTELERPAPEGAWEDA